MLRTLSSSARATPLAATTVISNETKTRTIIPLLGVGSTSRRVIQRAASRVVNRRGPTRGGGSPGDQLPRRSPFLTRNAARGRGARCRGESRASLLSRGLSCGLPVRTPDRVGLTLVARRFLSSSLRGTYGSSVESPL